MAARLAQSAEQMLRLGEATEQARAAARARGGALRGELMALERVVAQAGQAADMAQTATEHARRAAESIKMAVASTD